MDNLEKRARMGGAFLTDYRSPLAIEAQARWELEGISRAVARYREAAEHKSPVECAGARGVLREVVGPLTARIERAQEEAAQQQISRGQPPPDALILQLVEAERLAVMTLTVALRAAPGGSEPPLSALAAAISRFVRAQIEFDKWEQATAGTPPDEGADRFLRRMLAHRPANLRRLWPRWRKRVLETRSAQWPTSTSVYLGARLVGLLVEAAPARFSLVDVRRAGARSQRVLRVAPDLLAEMQQREARAEVARPMLMPMVVPPNDWRYETKESG